MVTGTTPHALGNFNTPDNASILPQQMHVTEVRVSDAMSLCNV